MTKDSFPSHAIAVVGLAGRFPGARDLDHFWQNIRNGVEIIETLSEADLEAAGVSAVSRNDSNWVRKATTLEGALDFDTHFFGISPREAQFIDPQQRVFLECAYEALRARGMGGSNRWPLRRRLCRRRHELVPAGAYCSESRSRAGGGRLSNHAGQRQGLPLHPCLLQAGPARAQRHHPDGVLDVPRRRGHGLPGSRARRMRYGAGWRRSDRLFRNVPAIATRSG